MTALNKQALIAKIKKQTESFDTVVLKEDEANLLLNELEAADKRIANNERVMRAVVEAASIRGIRPFEGIECDPPTLEENAEACGDAMSARIRELEANPPKPHHNGLMQISNELVQARQRIAELESNPIATLDVQSERADGNKFALVYSSAAHKLPDDVYYLCVAAAGIGVKGE